MNEFVANTSSSESQRQIGINSISIGFQLLPLERRDVEKDHENAAERALRAKKRRQQAIERAELEAAKKKKRVHESGVPIAKIDFSEPTSSALKLNSFQRD